MGWGAATLVLVSGCSGSGSQVDGSGVNSGSGASANGSGAAKGSGAATGSGAASSQPVLNVAGSELSGGGSSSSGNAGDGT
ncbi:MAG TPA: hypothetical protein VNG33_06590, partial [Polyangiaceae bacterium]|nr:hypothetical protein [Polyangiaceae bacterium]